MNKAHEPWRPSGEQLEELAGTHGTPLYVYDAQTIRARYRALDRALDRLPHRVLYAVKANSNGSVLRVLKEEGAGADVVSAGELARALRAGIPADRIVFSGTGKTREELAEAARRQLLLVNVEVEDEIAVLAEEGRRLGRPVRVSLRVNPDVDAGTHPAITTGTAESKFGIPLDAARAAYGRIRSERGLRAEGVAFHLGSQIATPEPIVEALDRIAGLVDDLLSQGMPLRWLNLGGGFGIRYRDEMPMDADAYMAAVSHYLQRWPLELLVEPGRWIVGPAGVLLTRVLYVKRTARRNFLVVDAAMNDLLRPTLYGAHHEIAPVTPGKGKNETYDVVGPICESGDVLGESRTFPPVRSGDLLVVRSAGAYGFSMASNYNSRPRPAEVLLEGGRARLARRRETIEDLWRGEENEVAGNS
jgi:diaminopimelate decarboxylase